MVKKEGELVLHVDRGRSMALPEGVKSDDIEATTSDGVLELRIPVPAPQEKPAKTVKVEPKS